MAAQAAASNASKPVADVPLCQFVSDSELKSSKHLVRANITDGPANKAERCLTLKYPPYVYFERYDGAPSPGAFNCYGYEGFVSWDNVRLYVPKTYEQFLCKETEHIRAWIKKDGVLRVEFGIDVTYRCPPELAGQDSWEKYMAAKTTKTAGTVASAVPVPVPVPDVACQRERTVSSPFMVLDLGASTNDIPAIWQKNQDGTENRTCNTAITTASSVSNDKKVNAESVDEALVLNELHKRNSKGNTDLNGELNGKDLRSSKDLRSICLKYLPGDENGCKCCGIPACVCTGEHLAFCLCQVD